MTIRLMQERDLPRMTEIAQRGMEFEPLVTEALLREKTMGSFEFDPELGLVSERDGVVVAFAQGAMGQLEKNRTSGYVRLMVVDRAWRRQGTGSELLREMEQRLQRKGATVVSVFDCPHNYYMPGVDFRYTEAYCFLQKHGYEMFRENHNLVCDLDPDAWPELDGQASGMARHGIEVRRATPADRDAINVFLDENWPGWKFEVHGALDNDPATLYIGLMDGQVVAFSGYQGNNRALPWFGPMGTSPLLRGKGVGGILFRLCLRDMARQGWNYSVIPWVGPVRFYARYSGARFDRCFWAYRKELSA